MNNWKVRAELSVLQNAAMAIGTQEAMVGAQIVIMRSALREAATRPEADAYAAAVSALENRAKGLELSRRILEGFITEDW